jgi:hypothetical protein
MAVVGKPLRRIGDPVVAAAPTGVRVRTRLHLTEHEAAALGMVGEYLGSVYRTELAGRVGLHDWTAGNTQPGGRSVSRR